MVYLNTNAKRFWIQKLIQNRFTPTSNRFRDGLRMHVSKNMDQEPEKRVPASSQGQAPLIKMEVLGVLGGSRERGSHWHHTPEYLVASTGVGGHPVYHWLS